ncbi:hypothetical protein CALCODRAFT_306705 [Calocera cornea HHB12733]|uniref:Uncharacterized protein n=1 Tax=Calocera cornea HHB12733 TaxID=1353952 RepID=A0A165JM21_9BASI|nr:hypothetical protein CALCODRAFT_306705 [Calocera cornea HHB12733]
MFPAPRRSLCPALGAATLGTTSISQRQFATYNSITVYVRPTYYSSSSTPPYPSPSGATAACSCSGPPHPTIDPSAPAMIARRGWGVCQALGLTQLMPCPPDGRFPGAGSSGESTPDSRPSHRPVPCWTVRG